MSMKAVTEHVTYQMPNEHSRVVYLWDAIHNIDAGVQASMESAKIDNDPSGLRNNFESATAHLLLYDPVQEKQISNNKHGAAEILYVNGENAQVYAFGTNPGIGKTGMHLRYHKLPDYKKLSNPQQGELRD